MKIRVEIAAPDLQGSGWLIHILPTDVAADVWGVVVLERPNTATGTFHSVRLQDLTAHWDHV
ncbi:MAG TPA: hypothetical protein VJ931_12700 [Actinomycetota bacterium]|nr:hypothetical protein [Actinomycetota bacterium]